MFESIKAILIIIFLTRVFKDFGGPENWPGTDLENLTEWFKSNKLSLNIAKTNFMLFSKKHPKPNDDTINLSLANETINRVTSTKFLGMIDDKLSWEVHLNYTKNKMSSGLYALNKSKHVSLS